MKAAVALVAEEGVSASTFEAIARRSGYSRGLVGQRFGSKLGLIEAVIDYLHDGRASFAEAGKLDDLGGLEALLTYADHYIQRLSHMGEVQAYFRLLSWAVADISAFRSLFAAEHERIGARFEGWDSPGPGGGPDPAGPGPGRCRADDRQSIAGALDPGADRPGDGP